MGEPACWMPSHLVSCLGKQEPRPGGASPSTHFNVPGVFPISEKLATVANDRRRRVMLFCESEHKTDNTTSEVMFLDRLHDREVAVGSKKAAQAFALVLCQPTCRFAAFPGLMD